MFIQSFCEIFVTILKLYLTL